MKNQISSKSIMANALGKLSQEGPPFDNIALPWEPQESESKINVSMNDLTRFVKATLDELLEQLLK